MGVARSEILKTKVKRKVRRMDVTLKSTSHEPASHRRRYQVDVVGHLSARILPVRYQSQDHAKNGTS